MTRVSGIYAICNTVTGEAYIGRTSYLPDRWKAHKRLLQRGKCPNVRLQASWSRDGAESFTLLILERHDPTDLHGMEVSERRWLKDAATHGVKLYNVIHNRAALRWMHRRQSAA